MSPRTAPDRFGLRQRPGDAAPRILDAGIAVIAIYETVFHVPDLFGDRGMWPRREAELLAGGSVYWVIQKLVQCRQRILRLDEVTGGDGIRRCAMVLDPTLIRTTTVSRRPFQGWRYLPARDAPADLGPARTGEDSLPPELSAALADIGVL